MLTITLGTVQSEDGEESTIPRGFDALNMLQENHILAALPEEVRKRLYPQLELVPMPLGKVLYESGDTLRHVYFPIDCIVSLLYVMEDGASAEISVVGNEGIDSFYSERQSSVVAGPQRPN